ncbi:PREDICTED: odorant receptor 85c-like [Nicrophorus vespilloides]|uniref:Odorant receptor n=1 Tax=Nicrophorus vespilloides TaxID=110193 RepID=A0ABM1MYF2_NICVS|nr:PREDICTED: odorant receptor 85c-like [Nicrophorus vespilloides]
MKFFKKFKKEVGQDDCMNFALKYMRIILADPNKSKDWHFYLALIIFFALSLSQYYLVILLFFHLEGSVDNLSNAAQSFTSYFQTFLNIYPLIVYRKTLGKLFRNRAMFWKCDDDPESSKELKETYTNTYRNLSVVFMFVVSTEMAMLIKPFFVRELLVALYIPPYPYAYEILLVFQSLFSMLLATTFFAVNATCISLFADAIAQFQVLNHNVRNIRRIENSDEMSELKRCLKYHTFLLDLVSDIQRIYSIPLFGQYLMTIGATCMNLYMLTSNVGSTGNKFLSTSYICMMNLLFALYCFLATSLGVAIEELPNSFYFNNWEDGSKEFRKSMVMCIVAAQKEFVFKAGGLTEIYRGAITAVFKTTYSFLLIMQNMKAQK